MAEPAPVVRPAWSQLPAPAKVLAGQLGLSATNFEKVLAQIDTRTNERLREGDWDQLIYYMLQSRSFTPEDPIEPARSAAEYIPAKPRVLPANVRVRMDSFLKALSRPSNERLKHLAAMKPERAEVEARYGRAMEFLYDKEVRCREAANPQACIADLYANRGLSSDTSEQAFRIVEAAAGWAGKPRRILILGPGVDFAPRTALKEDAPPRMFQPAQVMKLFRPERVDCADVNPLVIAYARAECGTAYIMNLATRFLNETPGWDLIIATNILLYLDERELLLAMNNIRMMLSPGGIFLHNDGRFAAEVFGRACGLPVIKFGNITLDAKRSPPLTDRYVLHRRGAI